MCVLTVRMCMDCYKHLTLLRVTVLTSLGAVHW